MEKEYAIELYEKIKNLHADGLLENKKIIVFGHCDASEKMIDLLHDFGYTPVGIADNNAAKEGMRYKGVEVFLPRKILIYNDEDTIILIASAYFEQMAAECRKAGFNNIVRAVDCNTFSAFSLNGDIFKEKTSRVKRGYGLYKKIAEAFDGCFIFVCPYNAMGDVYEVLKYLPYYLRKMNIEKFVLAVQGEACRQVAKMFEVKNILCLTRKEIEELQQCILFMQCNNAEILHHNRPYTNVCICLSDNGGITFDEHYKIGVFGLTSEAAAYVPNFREKADFSRLVRGKSAIVSPYAKSMVGMSMEFWENKAAQLKEKGLFVYTNVSGDEKAIRGTTPVSYKITEMISAVEYAGYFVGIRSGLCDILQTADCQKEIIYPDCIYSTTNITVKEFFEI